MSGDDDRPGWVDREKPSFSELDKRRRERRDGQAPPPRSAGARRRTEQATRQYLRQVDTLFSKGKGGAEGENLLKAMRDAHGTPGLAAACRAYRDAVGMPQDPRDLALFFDCGDTELVVAGLGALRGLAEAGTLQVSAGLRSQLRMLSEDADDAVAEAAEEVLELLA